VAGPEYFGLNDPTIVEQIEALDKKKVCGIYWKEKQHILVAREEYLRNHPKRSVSGSVKRERIPRAPRYYEEPIEETYTGVWSAIERRERYEKRSGVTIVDEDNPLPDYVDPVTMSTVVNPYISPYGHVMGYSTWVQCLKETSNQCPFTKQPLSMNTLTRLTKKNFDFFDNMILSY
jgi:hypothetical protein